MSTINGHTTRANGTILTAAIYNFDHVNHVSNAQNLNTDKVEGATPPVVDGHAVVFDGTSGTAIRTFGAAPISSSNTVVGSGKQTFWVPATAMKIRTVGPAIGSFSASSTQFDYLAFDPTNAEDATFTIAMPKSWDEGTFTFQAYWMHPATVTNFGVAWQMFAKSYSNDDIIDGATYGGGDIVVDTGGTTNDLYISNESTTVESDTPAENDLVNFIIRRLTTDGGDTMAVDAFLIGLRMHYITNANTDA
jgi:hypothetical protein